MRIYPQLQYVSDNQGRCVSVLIPADLWESMEPSVRHFLEPPAQQSNIQPSGPLDDFKELLQCWDFKYPYTPEVRCPHCGKQTDDWRTAPDRPFILANANIGGLLVFHCRACGTTIRQKHFRDHVAFEHTTPRP